MGRACTGMLRARYVLGLVKLVTAHIPVLTLLTYTCCGRCTGAEKREHNGTRRAADAGSSRVSQAQEQSHATSSSASPGLHNRRRGCTGPAYRRSRCCQTEPARGIWMQAWRTCVEAERAVQWFMCNVQSGCAAGSLARTTPRVAAACCAPQLSAS